VREREKERRAIISHELPLGDQRAARSSRVSQRVETSEARTARSDNRLTAKHENPSDSSNFRCLPGIPVRSFERYPTPELACPLRNRDSLSYSPKVPPTLEIFPTPDNRFLLFRPLAQSRPATKGRLHPITSLFLRVLPAPPPTAPCRSDLALLLGASGRVAEAKGAEFEYPLTTSASRKKTQPYRQTQLCKAVIFAVSRDWAIYARADSPLANYATLRADAHHGTLETPLNCHATQPLRADEKGQDGAR